MLMNTETSKLIRAVVKSLSLWGGFSIDALTPERLVALAEIEDTPRNRKLARRVLQIVSSHLEQSWEEERKASIAFYKSIIMDDRVKIKDKLEARKRLDDLLSLHGRAALPQEYTTISHDRLQEISRLLDEALTQKGTTPPPLK